LDATVPIASSSASLQDARPIVPATADDSAQVDAEVDVGSQSTDSDGVDGSPSIALPTLGDLAITEVMLSPSGPEPASEWFEIYNLAWSSRLLNGLTIQDGYGDTAVVPSAPAVVLPAATYGLLVRDQAAAVQTLLPSAAIVYAYGTGVASTSGIELDEGSAGDLSLWSGDVLLADVPYGMWDASWVGQSIELKTLQSDPTDPMQWCIAQSPWVSGSDDGTPGAPNDCGR
jgi:hypothetical protein